MTASLPNWIRIVLLALSLLSFLPQLREFWLRRNASGISPYYVLFHLIGATELFAVAFFYIINSAAQSPPASDVFAHKPPRLGDYLNLVQLALVWMLWLVIFATVLLLPSEDGNHLNRGQNQTSGGDEQDNNNHSNAGVRNTTVLSIYLAFLFISLVPVVTDAVLPSQDASYHKWALALFHGVHTIFINPIVTVLILVSFVAQRDEILRHPPGAPSSSFSLVGLAVQAAVFALLALTWMWRLVLPWNESFDGHPVASLAWAWYQLVGFVAVDHVAFALVQAALLVVARSNPWLGFTNSETQPLLAGRN